MGTSAIHLSTKRFRWQQSPDAFGLLSPTGNPGMAFVFLVSDGNVKLKEDVGR